MSRFGLLLLTIFTASFVGSCHSYGTIRQTYGNRVIVDLPPTYEILPNRTGFFEKTSGITIFINESDSSNYSLYNMIFTPEIMKTNGYYDITQDDLERQRPYSFLKGRQLTELGSYKRFVGFFVEENICILIDVYVPEKLFSTKPALEEDIKHIMVSAHIKSSDKLKHW